MRHYCTLFDSKYLPQGLALYESLKRHSWQAFKMDILALDTETERTLQALRIPFVTPLGNMEYLNPRVVKAKTGKTWQEYCWMLASSWAEEAIVSEITYLDADTYFFSDPAPVFKEIGSRSIAITPHRLIPSKRHLEVNGLFNVGFVHFKNTDVGRTCLSRWAKQCRERCSATDGCGDQKYLDEWPELYGSECYAIENIGVNAGPWSLANWNVTDGPKLDGVPLICYHAHEFDYDAARLTNYELRPEDVRIIYDPYIAEVEKAKARIESVRQLT